MSAIEKRKALLNISSRDPTLTPLPSRTIGIPQINPNRRQNKDGGRKSLYGLKYIEIFKIVAIVSKAVPILIVDLPVRRG